MTSKARLFYPKELKSGLISKLSESQSHYTKNVMRLKPGDKISLFNSSNGEWDASILVHGKDLTEFKVEKLSRPQEENNNLWLAFSPIKKIPQDMMIQKTTELGVQKFIPLCVKEVWLEKLILKEQKKLLLKQANNPIEFQFLKF